MENALAATSAFAVRCRNHSLTRSVSSCCGGSSRPAWLLDLHPGDPGVLDGTPSACPCPQGARLTRFRHCPRPVALWPRPRISASRRTAVFEEIPSIRWGGRVGRYQESRRGVVRCVDPLSGKSLSFVSDWALENYLLSRFDPTVDTVRRALVVTAAGRQPVSAIADLLIERVNGRLEIQLICLREPPPAKFRVLKRQAEDQGARLVIRR